VLKDLKAEAARSVSRARAAWSDQACRPRTLAGASSPMSLCPRPLEMEAVLDYTLNRHWFGVKHKRRRDTERRELRAIDHTHMGQVNESQSVIVTGGGLR